MKINGRDVLLGVLVTVCVFLVLGSTSEKQAENVWDVSSSGVYPDLFLVNKQTGSVYRYLFYSPKGNPDKVEVARVESLGTAASPKYELVSELQCYDWKGYRYRPMPYEDY